MRIIETMNTLQSTQSTSEGKLSDLEVPLHPLGFELAEKAGRNKNVKHKWDENTYSILIYVLKNYGDSKKFKWSVIKKDIPKSYEYLTKRIPMIVIQQTLCRWRDNKKVMNSIFGEKKSSTTRKYTKKQGANSENGTNQEEYENSGYKVNFCVNCGCPTHSLQTAMNIINGN